ncbi:MAG: tRNA (adenosine(37)-N6)-threonylcarbamoyltransferase complex transferase subunit TsaD [archaeon]|nr:tRNA (adenosine(37)-N6)-threonylcarbamoyltransferase complex transferase subunit TsaD [archaeon]
MRILAIETSCDDTGIAILECEGDTNPSFRIVANQLASQIDIHQEYGGIYPAAAKREHEKNLPITLKKALNEANLSNTEPDIDAIAVTIGAGLSPCLWTGINFAKGLATKWNLLLIPVNHVEGHLLTVLAENKTIEFPAIALIVSGGHTQLILSEKRGVYKILGETRDDAAGECFDKTARILGLPYPGGPAISKIAKEWKDKEKEHDISLPRPMIQDSSYDVSFSGLKTAVLYDWKKRSEEEKTSDSYIGEMAVEIQQAIIDTLLHKTIKAVLQYEPSTIILGGGVAANTELREQLEAKLQSLDSPKNLLVASPSLCTDNGVMIGVAGYLNWLRNNIVKDTELLEAQPNLRVE